jgi:AcrR family transcriptional regulator
MQSKTRRKAGNTVIRGASGQARREQIVTLAARLFGEKGYDGTSLRDIAEAAGITKAALYYHFPDKERLYEDVAMTRIRELLEEVKAAIEKSDDPVEKIRLFLIASARRMDRDRLGWMASANIFWSLDRTKRGPAIMKVRDDYEHLLRDLIAEAIKQKRFRLVDPAVLGRLLLSGLNHMPRWHQPKGRLSAAQVVDQYLSIVLQGVAVS